MLEVDAASFRVADAALIEPVSLKLEPGRVHALIGHNGSGKSTLLRLLAGQAAPSAGRVLLDGTPLSGWKPRALARRMGFLPQQPPAAPGMLVRELVALGRYPWHGALGRAGAEDRARIVEAMALTDTAHLAHRAVETLSGGERQRAWIAMLVAQDAGWLLLDEPISALDLVHQVEVLALVRSLSRDRGIGVVLVLHDVNMAARYGDEVLALSKGRLIANISASEIMDGATLSRIYGLPMSVGMVGERRVAAPD